MINNMIYVLKSNNLVKVGYTKDFKSRFNNYKTHNPHIEVLFQYPDLPLSLEQELHSKLKTIVKPTDSKEWYEYQEGILNTIDETLDNIIVNIMKNVSVDLENYILLSNGWVVNLDLLKVNSSLKVFKSFVELMANDVAGDDINTYEVIYKDGSVRRHLPIFKTVGTMKEILSNPTDLYIYKYGEADRSV